MAKVLIVEDDADLHQVLSHVLFKAGHELHHAFNGAEGFEKILSVRPDLVVLDLRMPVMSGAEVLKKVGENPSLRQIPIIVMTAYADDTNVLEDSIRAYGAREFVKKPFQVKELITTIQRVLKDSAPQKKPLSGSVVEHGLFRLDFETNSLWKEGRLAATLRPKEASILGVLLRAKSSVPRGRILEEVWGGEGSENTLYKTIQRLRDALGPTDSGRLRTRNGGYSFESDTA